MVDSKVPRTCGWKSPNHHLSTTVLDSLYGVLICSISFFCLFFSVSKHAAVDYMKTSQGHCSRRLLVLQIQAVLPCLFLIFKEMRLFLGNLFKQAIVVRLVSNFTIMNFYI